MDKVLIPVDEMFADYAAVHVPEEITRLVQNGNSFYLNQIVERRMFGNEEPVRVYDRAGRFYGVYKFSRAGNKFVPWKMFL